MLNIFNPSTLLQIFNAVVDICCTWVVFYYVLKIVRNNSRTIQIFKGIVFVIIIQAIANLFNLRTMSVLANMFVNWGPLALIILFSPEIRSILEKIGKTNVLSRISTLTSNEREYLVDELVKAAGELSKTQTGALITLEQGHSLTDYIKTGTKMNSIVTSELLCSIFVPGTPLHDGAVIIQGDKIACASAYFPPTTFDFPSSYGARHRAAIGISEITDSISIVVSEETGKISIAEGGRLTVVDEEKLREYLLQAICLQENVVSDQKVSQQKDDEIEFEYGHEKSSHKGPRITAYLLKNAKKYSKVKVDDKKEENEESDVKSTYKKQAARANNKPGKEVAEEIVFEALEEKPKRRGRRKKEEIKQEEIKTEEKNDVQDKTLSDEDKLDSLMEQIQENSNSEGGNE
ncbi:diadenylate cyclase CdaA [Traorella massiliensis]|uniref:diadenylate cyclase CdaA n=1 Tax=Traorella massiliensis TaxID=1903263 RepID=UPI0008F8A4D5|nr:diadenylate cyclase CdaA [Traorella massiliensis]